MVVTEARAERSANKNIATQRQKRCFTSRPRTYVAQQRANHPRVSAPGARQRRRARDDDDAVVHSVVGPLERGDFPLSSVEPEESSPVTSDAPATSADGGGQVGPTPRLAFLDKMLEQYDKRAWPTYGMVRKQNALRLPMERVPPTTADLKGLHVYGRVVSASFSLFPCSDETCVKSRRTDAKALRNGVACQHRASKASDRLGELRRQRTGWFERMPCEQARNKLPVV
ncbi:hypothetical protein HPB48_012402 [Haemaphysalis longicornis]|uniref:Uncharacterized protein n=1 Tax=Haemaphysalis longicornis TaxID=44386 RepID=A0A9J6FT69_HAELO|nr:hypothetical protein HPB48_012402 [Haemaphysalis longicornis]